MFASLVVKDDFFSNPNELVEVAKTCEYFCGGAQEGVELRGVTTRRNEVKGSWRGFRSPQIQNINKQLSDKVFSELFNKLTKNTYIRFFEYTVEAYFHYLPSACKFEENWKHTDDGCIFAGVVYLNKTPCKESGTMIFDAETKTTVDNRFNRLVFFDPTKIHSAQGSFGESVDDARLTLNLFVTKFNMQA